jgi:hypothetical protein
MMMTEKLVMNANLKKRKEKIFSRRNDGEENQRSSKC